MKTKHYSQLLAGLALISTIGNDGSNYFSFRKKPNCSSKSVLTKKQKAKRVKAKKARKQRKL